MVVTRETESVANWVSFWLVKHQFTLYKLTSQLWGFELRITWQRAVTQSCLNEGWQDLFVSCASNLINLHVIWRPHCVVLINMETVPAGLTSHRDRHPGHGIWLISCRFFYSINFQPVTFPKPRNKGKIERKNNRSRIKNRKKIKILKFDK